jgi:four helix bundle protein
MRDFRKLAVWEKSHRLAQEAYRLTASFPREELLGPTSQIRRAGSSIPTNIAEGCGRDTVPDFGRFLRMAMGSASELDYLVLLSRDLKLLSDSDYEAGTALVVEVKSMLASLIRKLDK